MTGVGLSSDACSNFVMKIFGFVSDVFCEFPRCFSLVDFPRFCFVCFSFHLPTFVESLCVLVFELCPNVF